MEKISTVGRGESQFKQALLDAELILEQQHQTKQLNLILGTGNKIKEMTKAFQKAITRCNLFAADFGGLSQHSRKMFELTKAAKVGRCGRYITINSYDCFW